MNGHQRRWLAACQGERGAVGSLEVLAFGFLIFVVGTLLLVNAWAVIDGKLVATAAAREAARAFVESAAGSVEGALAEAQAAATGAVEGHKGEASRMGLSGEGELLLERCAPVTFVVSYQVDTISLPWMGSFGGSMTATARHTEVVDPYRSGVPFAPGDEPVIC